VFHSGVVASIIIFRLSVVISAPPPSALLPHVLVHVLVMLV